MHYLFDDTQFEDSRIQVINNDNSNFDTERSNFNAEKTVTEAPINPDHSKLTLAEKKKPLREDKVATPNRDSGLIKKIFSERTLAIKAGKRNCMGIKIRSLSNRCSCV